jgi:hypothetical protein
MIDITIPEGSPFVHFGGTTWPIPGDRLRDLEQALRYARKDACYDMKDRLLAASVINAYFTLVWQTQKRRNEIANHLIEVAKND